MEYQILHYNLLYHFLNEPTTSEIHLELYQNSTSVIFKIRIRFSSKTKPYHRTHRKPTMPSYQIAISILFVHFRNLFMNKALFFHSELATTLSQLFKGFLNTVSMKINPPVCKKSVFSHPVNQPQQQPSLCEHSENTLYAVNSIHLLSSASSITGLYLQKHLYQRYF